MTARWTSTMRILDANLNRAREAARVAEDYARFALDSAALSARLKTVRHTLRDITAEIDARTGRLLAGRDTPQDVGTAIATEAEGRRGNDRDVAVAAMKRLEEALRTIEEYTKSISPAAAAKAKQLRYETYAIESALLGRAARLGPALLYVIITKSMCRGRDVAEVAAAAIRGGAGIIQLREKGIAIREVLAEARALRKVTADAGALLIVNDHIGVAAASGADGVHLGNEDMPIADARRLLGAGSIIGLTAHSLDEATQAEVSGADYIGLGTIFKTMTKERPVAGTGLIGEVRPRIAIPAYAIGGIDATNVSKVIAAGADRVAVCSAIIGAEDVEAATRAIAAHLPPSEEGHD